MRILLIIAIIMALMPTAHAQVTDFTVIEPFPETVVAGNHVNATVSFVSDGEPFNLTMTFTSPTLLSEDMKELIDTRIDWDCDLDYWCVFSGVFGVCEGNISGSCMYETSDYEYIQHCIFNDYGGTHIITAGFILNPALKPDDYTFSLTVSGYEEEPHVVTSTKKTKTYSGSHQVIEKEEPFRHFIDNWSPYESWNGNGEINLGGGGINEGYVYGNKTDDIPEDTDEDFEDIIFMFKLILLILVATVVVSIFNIISLNKVKKKNENKQKHS